MQVTIEMNDNITTNKFQRPETMTLRHLLEFLYRQQGSDERFQRALDMPLSIGIRDGHSNFEEGVVWSDYPHYRDGVPPVEGIHDGSPGMVRIDCHLKRYRLVKAKERD